MGDFEELEKKVIAWANSRGLLHPNGANAQKQLLKSLSELGELADALLKNNRGGIIDGIGDVLVTLIIFAELVGGYDLTLCLECAYQEIKNRKGQTVDGVFIKE